MVIHGLNDKLVHVSGGRATARAIPGAELVLVPGMGHDMPRQLWPVLVDGVARTAARADAKAGYAPRFAGSTTGRGTTDQSAGASDRASSSSSSSASRR
jgi:hypothetical protein